MGVWDVVDISHEIEKDEKAYQNFEDFSDEEFEECKTKASTGDVEAQAMLGLCYLIGLKVDQDPVLGYKWTKKAADKRFAPAEFLAAYCFKEGLGVEKDKQQYLYWVEKSACDGYVKAQFMYGVEIEHGNVCHQNQTPFKWYKMAAEQGHAEAQNNLGWLYQKGIGGAPESGDEAFRWYEKSAKQGIAVAQFNLGYCYYYGIGVRQDETKAMEWIRKSADQGYETAIETLQNLKYGGLGAITKYCYITTAVCCALNKGDNCYELQMFRKFRDEWLLKQRDGKTIIEEYYRIAPKIVNTIDKQADSLRIYKRIWDCYLKKCLTMIENGQNRECKNTYMTMVQNLKDRFY